MIRKNTKEVRSGNLEGQRENLSHLREYLNHLKKDFLAVRVQKEMKKKLLETGGKLILFI